MSVRPNSTITKRQLAARFVDALGSQPLPKLAAGLMEAAVTAGYTNLTELDSLVTMVEYELQGRRSAVEVRLATAHRLPAGEVTQLAGQIAHSLGAHSHSVVHRVDANLIGGFEATAGDSAIRGSIRAELKALEAQHA